MTARHGHDCFEANPSQAMKSYKAAMKKKVNK
jgi:hypothetical protein